MRWSAAVISSGLSVIGLVAVGCSSGSSKPSDGPDATCAKQDVTSAMMQVTAETAAGWQQIHDGLDDHDAGTSEEAAMSVSRYLTYNASARDQALCGNCWVWAGTAALDIALNQVRDGLDEEQIGISEQWLDSLSSRSAIVERYSGAPHHFRGPCCGGNLSLFADIYNDEGDAVVPVTNSGAQFQDSNRSDADGECLSNVSTSEIDTTGEINVGSLSVSAVRVSGGEASAIASLKGVIDDGHAVVVSIQFPNGDEVTDFDSMWSSTNDPMWSPNDYCGETYDECNGAAGHAVAIIGYVDDGTESGSYWTVLNSWGTTSSRPAGTFKMQMHGLDYVCQLSSDEFGDVAGLMFQVLNVGK